MRSFDPYDACPDCRRLTETWRWGGRCLTCVSKRHLSGQLTPADPNACVGCGIGVAACNPLDASDDTPLCYECAEELERADEKVRSA